MGIKNKHILEGYMTKFLVPKINNLQAFNEGTGHAVAQLVEALRYNPERRGFDSRLCHWNFSLT
jgi:hypothetical protein